MPVTVTLRTYPARKEIRTGCGTSTIIDIMGRSLGKKVVPGLRNVADITREVQAFGDAIAAEHPMATFVASTTLARGDRAPAGYNAEASRVSGFGQDKWARTVDLRVGAPPPEDGSSFGPAAYDGGTDAGEAG